MRTLLFFLSGLLLLAGCREFNPRTTVRGRAINAITREPIEDLGVVIYESCGVLAGGNCGGDVAEAITDSDGRFEMEGKSRGNADVDYICLARKLHGEFLSNTFFGNAPDLGLNNYITLTKFEENDIEMQFAPTAWIDINIYNDGYINEQDEFYLIRGFNQETGFETYPSNSGGPVHGMPLPPEQLWVETIMGHFVTEYQVTRNGQTTFHADTVWIGAGDSVVQEIHY